MANDTQPEVEAIEIVWGETRSVTIVSPTIKDKYDLVSRRCEIAMRTRVPDKARTDRAELTGFIATSEDYLKNLVGSYLDDAAKKGRRS